LLQRLGLRSVLYKVKRSPQRNTKRQIYNYKPYFKMLQLTHGQVNVNVNVNLTYARQNSKKKHGIQLE